MNSFERASEIRAIGRALPEHYYPSEILCRALHERTRVERIHSAASVRGPRSFSRAGPYS